MKARLVAISLLVYLCTTAAESFGSAWLPGSAGLTSSLYQAPGNTVHCPSGLHIVYEKDDLPRSSLAVAMAIGTGAAADPKGKEGLAHLVEHLWFRSVQLQKGTVHQIIDDVGARGNGFTSLDDTVYITIVPRWRISTVLRLEMARLEDALAGIDQSILDTERAIVLNEMAMQPPRATIGIPTLNAMLFPEGHPYHDVARATRASLERITLEDVRAFVRDHYRPSNATIFINGNLQNRSLRSLLGETLPREVFDGDGDGDGDATSAHSDQVLGHDAGRQPVAASEQIVRLPAPVDSPTLLVGWRLPPAYQPTDVTGTLYTSILNRKIRKALGTVTPPLFGGLTDPSTSRCEWVGQKFGSLAVCSVVLRRGEDPARVLKKIVRRERITTDWDSVAATGSLLYANRVEAIRENENPFPYLLAKAKFAHHSGSGHLELATMGWLNKLNAEAFVDLRDHYFSPENRAAILLEPTPVGQVLLAASETNSTARAAPTARARRAQALRAASESTSTSAVESPGIHPPSGWNPNAGMTAHAVVPNLSRLKTATLKNGLKVVLFPTGESPHVQARIIFRGGTLFAPDPALPALSELVTLSPNRLTLFAHIGSWHTPVTRYPDFVVFDAGRARHDVGVQLKSFRQTFEEYYPDLGKSFADIRALDRSAALSLSHPNYWRKRLVQQHLYPGHPLARSGLWDPEIMAAMKALTTQEVVDWNRRVFRPDNATLLVVGAVGFGDVLNEARRYLETWWPPPGHPLPPPPPPPRPRSRHTYLLDAPGHEQTELVLSCQVGPASEDNLEALQVLKEALNTLLWQRIREDLGASYDPRARITVYAGGAATLSMSLTVENDAVPVALDTLLDAPKYFHESRETEELVTRMKVAVARKSAVSFHTSGQLVQLLSEPIRLGYDWDMISKRPERLEAVTAHDLARTLDRCVGHEAIVAHGPMALLEQTMQETGLDYTPIRMDRNGTRGGRATTGREE